jgi:hypothetical protein
VQFRLPPTFDHGKEERLIALRHHIISHPHELLLVFFGLHLASQFLR